MQLKSKSRSNHYLIPLCATLIISLAPLLTEAQDGTPTVPVFQDGEAQVVEGFKNPKDWIEHDLFVETEFDTDGDGKKDRMHVSVSRQKQTETEGLKVPVVYVTSPYFAGVSGTDKTYFWNPEHELNAVPPARKNPPPIKHQSRRPVISRSHLNEWIPRGYAVVHSCSPGTGLSQGCPTVGGKNESLAPKAVVDWLCGRAKGYTSLDGNEEVTADWCTGKVGMTGTSYNGTLPLACATTGVEGLEAIIPIAPNTSYYHYYRSHGLVRHPGGYMGEDIDVLYDFIHSGDPKNRDHCDCEVRDKEMADNMDRITGDYNDFWAGRDYLNQLDKLKAPVLMAHAFNDWNVMPEHSVRIYQALKEKGVPVQCYFHQGGHGGPPPMKQMNRWFTRYLHGIENGVEDDPKAWVVREKAKRTEPTPYGDYPNPDATAVELLPTRLMENGKGGLELNPPKTSGIDSNQGKQTFTDDVSLTGTELAQSDSSDHRLLFVTPELKEPVHLSGTPSLSIKVASSKSAANLSVWVVSLPWNKRGRITDNIITRGWADPQNHKSLSESEPLKPGQFYSLKFDLQPDDQVIPAGQQIGLMIFSSDRDFTLWPKPGTELTIDLDATKLELPVVGGAKAMKQAMGQ